MSLTATSLTTAYEKTGATKNIGGKTKNVIQPTHQANGVLYMPTYRQMSSTFPSYIFNQGVATYTSQIPSIDYIKHMLLRIDIVITGGAVTLVPCTYWFRHKSLRETANNNQIQLEYDDSSHINLLNRVSEGRQPAYFKTTNIESDDIGKYGLTKPLMPGTHTFYLPLLTSVFENFGGLYLSDLVGDLTLDLATPSTIIASGTGAISSTNISFMIEGCNVSPNDAKAYRDLYRLHAAECQFLQPIRSEFYSTTLTASSSNNLLRLNNVTGLVPYQTIMVRPTGTIGQNTNFATWQLFNIGDYNGAAIDLVDSSGLSLWGNGAAVPTRFIRQHMSVDNMDNDWVAEKPVYFMSYCQHISAALAGRIEGARYFDATSGDQIRLTLPNPPVQEVQTITFSNAPVATGIYSFSYKGEQSIQLRGNANVAAMSAAIQGMRGFTNRFVKVVCSSPASAGASFTVTFTDPEGEMQGDLLTVNVMDGMGASCSTSRTVAGIPGLNTGAYDVIVYSWVYSKALYSDNRLTSGLLTLQ